jgi:hypothetical protein
MAALRYESGGRAGIGCVPRRWIRWRNRATVDRRALRGSGLLSAAAVLISILLAAGEGMSKQEAVSLAKKTLAERLDVAESDIQVVRTMVAQWPDASLGCPGEPKGRGTDVVPGFRVLLRVGERLHRVHVGAGRAVVCGVLEAKPLPEGSGRTATLPMPADPALARMVAHAREDLERRLGVSADRIALVAIEAVVWPDASLGCPRPGMVYAQSTREGWLIQLSAGARVFEYHSGADREPFYCENPKPPIGARESAS